MIATAPLLDFAPICSRASVSLCHVYIVCMPALQVADFHCPYRTNLDAGYVNNCDESGGEKEKDVLLSCRVGHSFSPDGEGYWEAEEGGAGASGCNPYAGAVLLVPEVEDAPGKRKVRVHS